ncbi:ATP-binding protein [Streptomyces sp. NPDC047000]|uniref:ATP-binding protein n=1 Tax=Streptomyces sp. NPDC047000 TaxID=3155474 RepID=UPI00340B0516
MFTHRRTFPGDPRELRTVRDWIRATLDDHPHCDDAMLIATELCTNALLHTASGDDAGTFHVTVTVTATVCGTGVSIAVTDSGHTGTAPEVGHPPFDATHGRGLGMVAALAEVITVQSDGSGHTVTAELCVRTDLWATAVRSASVPRP